MVSVSRRPMRVELKATGAAVILQESKGPGRGSGWVLSTVSLCVCRYKLLRYSKERQHLDGLNNLHYTPLVSLSSLYKNITVDLYPELAPIADYWTAPTQPPPDPRSKTPPKLTQLPSGLALLTPSSAAQRRSGGAAEERRGGHRPGGVKRRTM